ncbi:MAG: hypothetical protein NVSMB52_15100 [Chloroflexota bacterium]
MVATESAPTVAYLEFFRRWDTPLDDRAVKQFATVVRAAPDYNSFCRLVPTGSQERTLLERFFGSFEEAGRMIAAGEMNENLFFDAWYGMPQTWERAKPYVLYMRQESDNGQLYSGFEWLAGRAIEFWAERERNPPAWSPLTSEPTAGDESIIDAFILAWSSDRDETARASFTDLERRSPSTEEFMAEMQPGSDEFIQFDRFLCKYDQAGTLIKNGILHPSLFFRSWRSPREFWPVVRPWIEALRLERKAPHLYDNVDWLVEYEGKTGSCDIEAAR